MKITAIPPEILEQILSYLEYDTVQGFISACPVFVRTKLRANGGLKSLSKVGETKFEKICLLSFASYRGPIIGLITPPWKVPSQDMPDFTDPLFSNLTSLTIAVRQRVYGLRVDKMPRTLTHLCWYALNVPFYPTPGEGKTISEALPALRHLDYLCEPSEELGKAWLFSQLPRTLQSLSFSSSAPDFHGFDLLPPELTMLSIGGGQYHGHGVPLTDAHFRAPLPITLTDLRLSRFRFAAHKDTSSGIWNWHLPHLRSLRLASVSIRGMAALPRTITCLDLTSKDNYNYESTAEPINVSEWPPNLLTFACAVGTALVAAAAPPTLTQLVLHGKTFGIVDSSRMRRMINPWQGTGVIDALSTPWLRVFDAPRFKCTESTLFVLPPTITLVTIGSVALEGNSVPPGTRVISSLDTLIAMFRAVPLPYTLICRSRRPVQRLAASFVLPEGIEVLTIPGHPFALSRLPPTITEASNVTGIGHANPPIMPPNLTRLTFAFPETTFPVGLLSLPNRLTYLGNARIVLKAPSYLHPSLIPEIKLSPSPTEASSSDFDQTSDGLVPTGPLPSPPVIEHLRLPEDALDAFKQQYEHIELYNASFDLNRILEGLAVFPAVKQATFTGKFYLPLDLANSGFGIPMERLDLSEGALMNSSFDEIVMPALPDTLTELILSGTAASRMLHPIHPTSHTERWLPKHLVKLTLITKAPGAGYSSHDFELPFMPHLSHLHIIASYISPSHVNSLPAHLDVREISEDRATLTATSSGTILPAPPVKPSPKPPKAPESVPSTNSWLSCTVM